MSNISHLTHRLMSISGLSKEKFDELRARAVKKSSTGFLFKLVEDEADSPLCVAFRYQGQYYTGMWPYSAEEFTGLHIDEGLQNVTQVFYRKPQPVEKEAA